MRLRIGSVLVDLDALSVEGLDHPLTPQEGRLLRRLAEAKGGAVARSDLLLDVWDFPKAVESRAVDNTMYRLRAKLGAAAERLTTVRGIGYRLECTVESSRVLLGRSEELRALIEWAEGPPGVLWLAGIGGIGKTSLSQAWAARVGARCVSLQGAPVGDGLARLGAQLGVALPPTLSGSAAESALVKGFGGARFAVLDSAEADLPLCERIAQALSQSTHVLVTTRLVPQAAVRSMALQELDPLAAAELLVARLGVSLTEARPVAEALGGVPLALEIAAGWASSVSLRSVIEIVHSGVQPLQASLDASWEWLSPSERRVLTAAAVLDTTAFSRLRDCTRIEPTILIGWLRRLADSGWMREESVLDPVRRFVLGQPEAQDWLPTAARWVIHHGTREEKLRLAGPLRERSLDSAAELVIAAARESLLSGPSPRDLLESVLEWVPPNRRDEAKLLMAASWSLHAEHERASEALSALASASSEAVRIEAAIRQAWAEGLTGPAQGPIGVLRRCMEQASPAHPTLEAMAAVRLGSLLHRGGDVVGAGAALERAVGVSLALGDEESAGRYRLSLALLRLAAGEVDAARPDLEAVVEKDRSQGLMAPLGQNLLNLGGLELVAERFDVARAHLNESLAVASALGDSDTMLLARLSLGVCSLGEGAFSRAVRELTAARVEGGTEQPFWSGMAWLYLAIAAHGVGDEALVAESKSRCVELLVETPAFPDARAILDGLGGGSLDAALRVAEQSADPFVRAATPGLKALQTRPAR